jgi:hypothetical protein
MTVAPRQRSYRGVRNKARLLLFWPLTIFLSLVWLRMHNMGQGTTLNHVIGFAPLVGIVVLLLFALIADWALKRRGQVKL